MFKSIILKNIIYTMNWITFKAEGFDEIIVAHDKFITQLFEYKTTMLFLHWFIIGSKNKERVIKEKLDKIICPMK